MGGGVGAELHGWHINVNVCICNSGAFYGSFAFAKNLILDPSGVEPRPMTPQPGHLTTSKPFQLGHPLFLEIIRVAHTVYPQLTVAALWSVTAAKDGANLRMPGPIRRRCVNSVRNMVS